MNSALEQKLIECLDALDSGWSVEQILARYPDDAAALRPMLETAVQLGQLKVAPATVAQNKSKQAFLKQAAALQSAPRSNYFWQRLWRALVPVMGVAAALLVGVLLLANAAIPGEPLYGVKLQLEDWRLSLARDPETIQTLTKQWEARRLAEVQQLLAAGLEADVVFGDNIATIASDHWMLKNGIRLNINNQTVIIGEPEVGVYLHIEGRTLNGAVEARLIHVGEYHSDLLDATPVPATPTTTPTPPKIEPSPIATLTPTPMISPSPTATPMPSPTATSTLEAGGLNTSARQDDDYSEDHDYGDDNGDDGDDNSGVGSGDDDNGDDDNSGSGNSDDGGDDNSGSGSGDDRGDDDNSGSGSSDDDDDGGDDNSGSGSGDD
ncbi:MAG: hypothetical protein Fur0021_11800 [Candidatus Promineifilaceae bacterium]